MYIYSYIPLGAFPAGAKCAGPYVHLCIYLVMSKHAYTYIYIHTPRSISSGSKVRWAAASAFRHAASAARPATCGERHESEFGLHKILFTLKLLCAYCLCVSCVGRASCVGRSLWCRAPSVWAPFVWVGPLWVPPLLCLILST